MTFSNFPTPLSSPWTDPKGHDWRYNGFAWVRFDDPAGKVVDAPIDTKQYTRGDGAWSSSTSEIYLGAFINPPSTRNTDKVLQPGDGYFDLTVDKQKIWDGRKWEEYGATYKIIGVTSFTWGNHPIITIGNDIERIDEYGNTFPNSWAEKEDVITIYSKGYKLIQEIDSAKVLGDYTVDYATANITIVNTQLDAGSLVINVHKVVRKQAKLYPYALEVYFKEEINNVATFLIYGGNFDQITKVVLDVAAITSIDNTVAKQDVILEFQILNQAVLPGTPIYVVNGNARYSFGNALVLPSYELITDPQWQT